MNEVDALKGFPTFVMLPGFSPVWPPMGPEIPVWAEGLPTPLDS